MQGPLQTLIYTVCWAGAGYTLRPVVVLNIFSQAVPHDSDLGEGNHFRHPHGGS